MQETVRNAAEFFFQTRYDQVQAECLRRVPVPDPVTGCWKRSRPEHAEGPAQPAKEPLDGEDHLPQTSKKRATSATAEPAETNPSRGILGELAERLGNVHDSARALASCLQNHDVSRKTDKSMIEPAKCMCHKLLGETVTGKSFSRLETLTGKLRSRFEMPSEKSA